MYPSALPDGRTRSPEQYFQSVEEPERLLDKPFVSLNATPRLLYRQGLLLARLKVGPTMRVLRCRGGHLLGGAHASPPQCSFVCVDASDTAFASRRLFDARPGPPEPPRFLGFNGETLRVESNSIDRIVCFDVLHHMPSPDRIRSEFRRACKTAGSRASRSWDACIRAAQCRSMKCSTSASSRTTSSSRTSRRLRTLRGFAAAQGGGIGVRHVARLRRSRARVGRAELPDDGRQLFSASADGPLMAVAMESTGHTAALDAGVHGRCFRYRFFRRPPVVTSTSTMWRAPTDSDFQRGFWPAPHRCSPRPSS